MLKVFRSLILTLGAQDRVESLKLLVLMIVTGVFESLGVVSIFPFLAVAAKPELIQTNEVLRSVNDILGLQSEQAFLSFMGLTALIMVLTSNSVSVYLNWRLALFTHMRAHVLSLKILRIYMFLPYAHFLKNDTADMAKNILSEVSHVTKNLFVAGMQVIARFIVCIFIFTVLFLTDPVLAISVGCALSLAYVLIYLTVHKKVHRIGAVRLQTTADRFKILGDILKGVKDIRLNGAEEKYIESYAVPSKETSLSYAQYDSISVVPRYALESVAYGITLVVILYMLQSRGDIVSSLPVLGLYAVAGQRLLPSLQSIFLNVTKLKYGLPSLDEISREIALEKDMIPDDNGKLMKFNDRLIVNNVVFQFSADNPLVLDHVSLEINRGQKVAFVGPTGAGKTTLVDIITGLILPSQGQVQIDGVALTYDNVRAWQRNLSYVSQNIFLFNDTFAQNIAVSEGGGQMDWDRIKWAAHQARLGEFIETQTLEGYNTRIGENGIRLSGGQRQRLGLARALYAQRPVLLLDEATSALDNVTEKEIMDAVGSAAEGKTIIMIAHRLSTVNNCDVIFYLEDGKILGRGTYDELRRTCPGFKKLSDLSTE